MNQVNFNPRYSLYLRKLSKSKKGIFSIALVITIGLKGTRFSLEREIMPQAWDLVQKKIKKGAIFPKGEIHLSFRIPQKAVRNCHEILFLMWQNQTENIAKTYLNQSVHFKTWTDESK